MTNEKVMEYRRKVESLTPEKKRIWDLAHTMMNEMMRSENAELQACYKSSTRHHDASRKAEDELLELLTAAPSGEPPQPRCPKCGEREQLVCVSAACGNTREIETS